jgi:hypothetical protein
LILSEIRQSFVTVSEVRNVAIGCKIWFRSQFEESANEEESHENQFVAYCLAQSGGGAVMG